MTMSTTPLVSILTYCAHPALAYGTLLVFKTLRTGFPTARIEVFDNGSHPDVVAEIARAAADVGATFEAKDFHHYADHLTWVLFEREHGDQPLVLVDPDVIFWESIERWTFGDALASGRLIPELGRPGMLTLPRLHPSLFWVPSVQRLRHEVALGHPEPSSLVMHRVDRHGACLTFLDTLSPLYQALGPRCAAFTESQLDAYDHLFYGSHLPVFDGALLGDFDKVRDGHRLAAAGELDALRGLWRQQDEYFASTKTCALTAPRPGVPEGTRRLESAKALQDGQGLSFTDEALRAAVDGLAFRLQFTPPKARRAIIAEALRWPNG